MALLVFCLLALSAKPSMPASPSELFNSANLVFVGEVLAASEVEAEQRVAIRVGEYIKGTGEDVLHVSRRVCHCSPALALRARSQCLVFGKVTSEGKVTANDSCSLVVDQGEFLEAAKLLRELASALKEDDAGNVGPFAEWCVRAIKNRTLQRCATREIHVRASFDARRRRVARVVLADHAPDLLAVLEVMGADQESLVVASVLAESGQAEILQRVALHIRSQLPHENGGPAAHGRMLVIAEATSSRKLRRFAEDYKRSGFSDEGIVAQFVEQFDGKSGLVDR